MANYFGLPILRLRHEDDYVDLVGSAYGFHLSNWTPAISPYKGEGVWRSSPLADGRRPVLTKHDNAIETFELTLNGRSMDDVIATMRTLQRMAERASEYWTQPYTRSPVYLEVRGSQETETRYAILYLARIESEANPFAQPFFSPFDVMGMEEVTLVVERGHWQDVPPGEYAPAELSTPLQEETTEPVYVGNRGNPVGLNTIFYYDASSGIYSTNLYLAPFPAALFPNPIGNGDILYLGCGVAPGIDAYTFSSAYFDLSAGAVFSPGTSLIYEYYGTTAGAASGDWRIFNSSTGYLALNDYTQMLRNSGALIWNFCQGQVSNVHFTYTTVNAVSGFWLRLRVNRPSGSISTPIAASRPSSILNPYVDVLADEKDGTLPSLARLELRNMSFRELYSPPYTTSDYAVIRSHTRRIYVAMRSLERGTAFNPYIYFTDNYRAEDNISASIIDASSSFGDDYSSATGRTLRVVNAPVTEDFVDRAKITIDADIANQYYGSYHVFLLNIHVYPGIENGYMYIRLKVNSGSGSEYKSTSFAATREYFSAVENPRGILDCGQITIPSSGMLAFGENANEITITIQSKTTYAYSSLYCGSVLLLPADEWIGAFEDRSDSYNGWLTPSTALALDSCGNPRVNTRALLTEYSGGAMRGLWQSITPGEIEIPANKDVRIWFWADQVDLWSRAKVEIAHVVQLHKVHRYLGSRGAI